MKLWQSVTRMNVQLASKCFRRPMPDPTLPLLQVCADLGLLALRDLYREVHELAGGKEFTICGDRRPRGASR